MAKTYINHNTLRYALKVLDTQKDHAEHIKTKEQKAYYNGLKSMLDLIISEEYTGNKYIEFDKELNTHKVKVSRGAKQC